MLRKKLAILPLLTSLLLLQSAPLSRAAKPASDAPATSILSDFVDGVPTRIGSDLLGSYGNGANSVSSIIQGIGDWVLDTKTSSLRRVRIDLGDPILGSGANPPFQAANVPVRFISKCASWNIFMPGMQVGQSALCPLALSINYNGTTYALRTNENYGGTDPVQWTCLARNSTKCVSWNMVPSVVQVDGQRKVAMQLVKPADRRTPEQDLGQFYMSFDISVTTP
jgi:hypothetical protein